MCNSAQNTIANLLKAKREEIIAIASKHQTFNVKVFGSVIRNQADTESKSGYRSSFKRENLSKSFTRCDHTLESYPSLKQELKSRDRQLRDENNLNGVLSYQ